MTGRILISGGGIAGLALAHGLKRAGIPVLVFERDANLDSRTRPFAMRITEDGKKGLKQILSPELYRELIRQSAEIGRENLSREDGATPLPAIDRGVLRKLLAADLRDSLLLGKEYHHYTLTENGVTAHFTDGGSECGSMLIGADGAQSRVRSQYLPEHKLLDTGGRLIWGKSNMSPEARKVLKRDTENGIPEHITSGTSTLIVIPIAFDRQIQNVPNDYVHWILCTNKNNIRLTDDEFSTLSQESAAELAVNVTNDMDCSDVAAEFRASMVINQNPRDTVTHTLYCAAPDWYNHPWQPTDITMLGDAIHPLGMGAGGGAAFKGAAELLQLFREHGVNRTSVGMYEKVVRERAKSLLSMSMARGGKLFGQATLS